MRLATQREIKRVILLKYSELARELYKEYRDVPTDSIRLLIAKVISEHIYSVTEERLLRKVRKVKKVKQENLEELFASVEPTDPKNIF